LMPSGMLYHFLARRFCSDNRVAQEACARVFLALTGIQEELFDRSMLSTYIDHLPAGCSAKIVQHYAQLTINGGK